MDWRSHDPNQTFARELAELDRELETRTAQDAALAALMTQLAALDLHNPTDQASGARLLLEIENKAPGSLSRMQAAIGQHRAGSTPFMETRLPDA